MSKIWDEVQGDCDATRIRRALDDTRGVDVSTLVLDGWTPLHYTCENRSVDDVARAATIRVLVDAHVNVDVVDENGWTALHLLCKNKHTNQIDSSLTALVTGSAHVKGITTESKKTALHLLCENDVVSPAAIMILINASVSVDAVDVDGNSALHYLTENASITPELLTILVEAKANTNLPNQFLSTPFHNLCQSSHLSAPLVRVMLQHKANVNALNHIGNTPFHYACENYSLTVETLQEFIQHKQINLTITNALHRTAIELIPSHKQDCIRLGQQYAAPSLVGSSRGSNTGLSVSTTGGEDDSELPTALAARIIAWNKTLPPFDLIFYNAICCEPAFAAAYNHVQEISLRLCEPFSSSSSTLLNEWEKSLTTWRSRVILAFTALVPPNLWEAYADKYTRGIPVDAARVRAQVVDVWKQFPDPTQRRHRFEALSAIFF